MFRRVFAKHRAANYAGRKKKVSGSKKTKDICGGICLLLGISVLYGKELPLLRLPQEGYKTIVKLAMWENRQVTAEEVLPVLYADMSGSFLRVSHADGAVPDYVPPEEEVSPVSVKAILEDRFGDLEQVGFQSFLSNYYIEDVSTEATADVFRITELAEYESSIVKKEEPQILIFHTHGSEGYADSRPGRSRSRCKDLRVAMCDAHLENEKGN